MPTKKPSQTEPLFEAGTEAAKQEPYQPTSPMGQRIMDQLRALDPEPFREVLRDILLSFKGTRWKGVDPDKRIKAGKDLAMLIGYANPSVIINHNTLHVERMSDVEIMAELGRARAQLALVMNGDATVLGTDLACLPAEGGTGGLGEPAGPTGYIKGGHAAHRDPEIEDALVISEPARSPAHSASPQDAEPVTPASSAKPGTMAAKIAELRAQGKISTPTNQNSKAPAAGAARPSGRKGGKK